MPYLSLFYVVTTVIFAIFNMKEILDKTNPHEAFFMGFSVCLMRRWLGFRPIKFYLSFFVNVTTLVLLFVVLKIHDPSQIILIISLEYLLVILAFKTEKAERTFHHNLYLSKNQLLKFQRFMTDYLPNQIVIFDKDLRSISFINEAFKKSFRCEDATQLKISLERLALEDQEMEKQKDLLCSLNLKKEVTKEPINLLSFVQSIAKPAADIKNLETISFQVHEISPSPKKPTCMRIPSPKADEPKRDLSSSPRSNTLVDDEESLGDAARAPSNKAINIRRAFKVKIIPLIWDDKESIGLVLDDITHERTIMELKIADKNKDLVIAMVSHELRTPLNGMLGIIDIIEKMLVQADVLPYLTACKNSSLMLLNLVNSILDFSQIKNKKLKLVHSQVNLSDLLHEIKSLFDYFCVIKELYLNIEIDSGVPETINIDETRLRQILINLVGNALKFTFKGGVTIKVRLEESLKLKFSVEDTGIGIKEEDQPKLFKLFGRLEHQDKKINTHGVGLGLTISNTIVMLLNPSQKKGIEVSSKHGKGTVFSFLVECDSQVEKTDSQEEEEEEEEGGSDQNLTTLEDERKNSLCIFEKLNTYQTEEDRELIPMENLSRCKSKHFLPTVDSRIPVSEDLQESNPLSKRPYRLSVFSPSSKLRRNSLRSNSKVSSLANPFCLIVDDNPFNLMVATNIMQDKGYTVTTALNGQEAIHKVQAQQKDKNSQFSLILMDCQMPVMDGYEATRELSQLMDHGQVTKVPIIALTANNRDEEHDKLCFEVGMIGILGKPLSIIELDSILQKINQV